MTNNRSNHYTYSYDNIGNRKTAQELAEESTYEANQLNQYTDITQSETAFTPTFDADGNQTLIKTSTGIWSVAYNADNRPTSFSQAQGDHNTIIECGYDYMGRRYTKKVTNNGTVSLHQRYIYRGYLQIACVDLTRSGHPALWYITWDPTEPVATRPLAIQKNATWYSYSHDLTKNVTELYQSDGLIASTYDYSPYGAATAEGTDQPIQYSSEYHDAELALSYYNYRHYNPQDGRWINRDPIGENGDLKLYVFILNSPIFKKDYLGGFSTGDAGGISDFINAIDNQQTGLQGMNKTPEEILDIQIAGPAKAVKTVNAVVDELIVCDSCPKEAAKTRKIPGTCGACEYRTEKPAPGYTPTSNGCGTNALQFPHTFPSATNPIMFKSACDAHDRCYGTCGSKKGDCDDVFYTDLQKICRNTIGGTGASLFTLAECKALALSYYIGVASVNIIPMLDPFGEAQDQACKWEKCD